MLILTNRDFVENSTQLENYIALKRSLGFNVDVATEDSYGGGNLQAAERFKKIREYLKGVCKNYDFLLCMCDRGRGSSSVPDSSGNFRPSARSATTSRTQERRSTPMTES